MSNEFAHIPKFVNKVSNQKNSKDVSHSLKVHFSEPILYKDNIILEGEVCYPNYRLDDVTNQRGMSYTTTVLDGWIFTNILYIAFDLQGNLLWNTVTPYKRPKSDKVDDRIFPILKDDGSILTVYSDGSNVKSVILNQKEITQGKISTSISGSPTNDKLKSSEANIVNWYDDYYIGYGTQDIKNSDLKGKDKKLNVFYLKKIKVDL